MAHPKRRHSNMRTRLRRSHDAISRKPATQCPNCKAAVLPHHVCQACGQYRGRQVITVKVKESKAKKD